MSRWRLSLPSLCCWCCKGKTGGTDVSLGQDWFTEGNVSPYKGLRQDAGIEVSDQSE